MKKYRPLLSFCLLLIGIGWCSHALAQPSLFTTAYLQAMQPVSLPTQVVAFLSFKEQQANDVAQKNGFELPADCRNFFADAKAGHAQQAQQLSQAIFHALRNNGSTNLTPFQKSPLQQVLVDASLGNDAFAGADADLVMALGRDLMNSLPAGCIYFGGTDPGRGLPTMLCSSPGDPIFVLTQNALIDGRYMRYVRDMYGPRIQLPGTNECRQIMDAVSADALRRSQHDHDFPNEPKQLPPGENVRIVDGKPELQGLASYVACNASIAKAIFDENPGREFYVEQSWPLEWMLPYLSPHGPILKLNRQPLAAISADDIKADTAYWSAKLAQLQGNSKFSGTDYVGKTYAHLRAAIASLYAWRATSAPDSAERQRMYEAAEVAFNQALALNSTMPDATYGLMNLEVSQGKLDKAVAAANQALAADPTNAQLKAYVGQMQNYQQKADQPKPTADERLKQVKTLYDQGLISKQVYDEKVRQIMGSL